MFRINGIAFQVDVAKLKRDFSIPETDHSGRLMDGSIYREPIGTYYNYTMTVRPRPGKQADMDAFWERISQPDISLTCTFPYNQQTLTQEMYVTGGEQVLERMGEKGVTWGEITLRFTALRPMVSE